MIERGKRPNLDQKPIVRGLAAGMTQELHRNHAVRKNFMDEVDRPHSTNAKLADHLVPGRRGGEWYAQWNGLSPRYRRRRRLKRRMMRSGELRDFGSLRG